jgi:hypothetical protein
LVDAENSDSDSEGSDVNTSDDEDSSWITWFCTLKVCCPPLASPNQHLSRGWYIQHGGTASVTVTTG